MTDGPGPVPNSGAVPAGSPPGEPPVPSFDGEESATAPAGPGPRKSWSLSRKVVALTLTGAFAALCDILLARHMLLQEYGTYRSVRTLVALLLPCASFGFVESLGYLLARLPRERYRAITAQTMALLFLLGGGIAALLVAAQDPVASWLRNPSLVGLLWLGGLTLQFLAGTQAIGALLICSDRVPLSSVLSLAFSLIYTGSVVLAWWLSPTPSGALGFVAIGAGLQFSIAVAVLLGTTRGQSMRPDLGVFREHWKSAWPLGLASAIGALAGNLDQLLVGAMVGAAGFATYWIGTAQMSFLKHATGAVNSVMIPELSRALAAGQLDRAFRLWHTAIRRLSLFIFPLVALLWTMAGPLIDALFKSKYDESVPIFRIALLAVPFKAVTFRALFVGSGQTKVIARLSILVPILYASLLYVFIRWQGARGAAMAMLALTWLLAAYFIGELWMVFKTPVSRLLPWRSLAGTAAVAAISAVVVWPLSLPSLELSSWTRCLLAGPLFVILYVTMAVGAGMIEPHEWRRLKEAVLLFRPRPAGDSRV